MLIGPALLVLAPAAAYGPADTPNAKVFPTAVADPCQSAKVQPDVIVVCGKREGYRIDADVMAAKRQYRNRTRPKPPEGLADTSCQVVGTMGCMNPPAINLLAAAATAATMLRKIGKGESIGAMFITDPAPSEYELYKAAKREREEREEFAAATAELFQTTSSAQESEK